MRVSATCGCIYPPKKWTQIRVLFSNCSALDVPSAVPLSSYSGFLASSLHVREWACSQHWGSQTGAVCGNLAGALTSWKCWLDSTLVSQIPHLAQEQSMPCVLPCSRTGHLLSTTSPVFSPTGLEERRKNDDRIYV